MKCDVIHVDGGHEGDVPLCTHPCLLTLNDMTDEWARISPLVDLENMSQLANPLFHTLLMDDTACKTVYCHAPQAVCERGIEGDVTE